MASGGGLAPNPNTVPVIYPAISTLNGQGASYTYWTYTNYKDRTSYINGQEAHVTFYSNVPAAQFANIQGN